MHTYRPFPVTFTADELADAMPRRLSSLDCVGTAPTAASGLREPGALRRARRPLDRGLPTLFRVR